MAHNMFLVRLKNKSVIENRTIDKIEVRISLTAQ